jgi:hypothetical protein
MNNQSRLIKVLHHGARTAGMIKVYVGWYDILDLRVIDFEQVKGVYQVSE